MDLIIGGGALVVSLTVLGIVLKQNANFQKSAEDKYVHKDVCNVQHGYLVKGQARIEGKIDKLIEKN